MLFFSADSKDDTDKWLCGLNILYQEVMSAPTPAITERYGDLFSLCEPGNWKRKIRMKFLRCNKCCLPIILTTLFS